MVKKESNKADGLKAVIRKAVIDKDFRSSLYKVLGILKVYGLTGKDIEILQSLELDSAGDFTHMSSLDKHFPNMANKVLTEVEAADSGTTNRCFTLFVRCYE